jgi:four helix bundle protein
MAVIKRFEDLIAWQEARKLTKAIRTLCRQGELARDFALCDQLRRAATSSMTNVAEGFDNESRPEFSRFLTIARRSSVEVQSLLYTALDDNLIDDVTFRQHYDMAGRTKSIINNLRRSLNTDTKRISEDTGTYDAMEPIATDTSDTNDTI